MGLFKQAFTETVSWERNTGSHNIDNEYIYDDPIQSLCASKGPKVYNKTDDSTECISSNTYHTESAVCFDVNDPSKSDRYAGYNVKWVTRCHDIFGNTQYYEVYVGE